MKDTSYHFPPAYPLAATLVSTLADHMHTCIFEDLSLDHRLFMYVSRLLGVTEFSF